ncbi:ribosome silencing factor [Comamonas endophytica]|uniref:Ribosomal silencing factor RsfS n=1 Tax=Comamonas endophytica TaxID=2949090 RepID=A0ABY6G9M8_9BURK|nr:MULTISPECIES: ribosome silencing factor [unclassified Acidovorax]MCD2511983.1 ribosome silencing factor [Acidovorax sp. D4N7]UYG51764.1 ribosome silencing factor [Acidovorax sp. 5MLIR]
MTTTPKAETAAKKDVTKLQRAIVDGLEDVKAQDIQVFNTEHLSPLFERVIVASGTSNRQTKALAASVREAVKEAGFDKPRVEGEDNGEWIIVDCGPAVAHIMQPAIRQYYRLEEIWGEKPVRLKLGAAKPAPSAANLLADKKAAQKAAKADAKAAPKSRAKPKAEDGVKAPAKKAVAKKPAAKTVAKGLAAPAASAKTAAKTAANAVAKEAAKAAAKTAAKAAAKPAAEKKPAAKKVAAKVQTVVVKPSVPRTAKPAAPAAKRAPRKAS